jgi:hypothetical protein
MRRHHARIISLSRQSLHTWVISPIAARIKEGEGLSCPKAGTKTHSMKTIGIGISTFLVLIALMASASDLILPSQSSTRMSTNSPPLLTNSIPRFTNSVPLPTNIASISTNIPITSTKMMIVGTNSTPEVNSPAFSNPYSSNGPGPMKVNSTAPAASAFTNRFPARPAMIITNANP